MEYFIDLVDLQETLYKVVSMMYESYEILFDEETKTVYIPIVKSPINLYSDNITCRIVKGSIHISDGLNTMVFLRFPKEFIPIVEEHEKITIMDVTCPEDLESFPIPVKKILVANRH